MTRRLVAVLLAAGVAIAADPAAGQTVPKPATDVAPVTVTGRRLSADQARTAACVEAMRDPQARALMASGSAALFGRTRPPRNPDYNAPPAVALDAPLPEVTVDEAPTRAVDFESDAGSPGGAEEGEARALSLAEAVAECAGQGRSRRPSDGPRLGSPTGEAGSALFWSRLTGANVLDQGMRDLPRNNGAAFGSFRAASRTMKKPDTTLPLALALFDQGRYALALDAAKAAQKARADVDGGDEAALMMGKIYLFAPGPQSDPVEAVKWLKWAANSYFNPRQNIQPFDPKRPDYTTAIGEASMVLADLYASGRGPVAKDPAESRKYLERAVFTGYVPASKRLGDIYYEGIDTPQDLRKAFAHYKAAATYAYAPAAVMLAKMYAAGEAPGGANPTLAAAWNNEAAKFDDPDALYAMAVAYDHGEGVAPDPERALGFYKIAAVNGYAPAQAAIGTYFYTGEGVPQDLQVARGWFEQAALAADPDGMFNLAAMMARGEGGEVDRVQAWGWLKIADSLGHPNAAAAAAALESQFTAAERADLARLTKPDDAAAGRSPVSDPELSIASEFVGSAPGGPAWWKVSKGEASVWILGTPPGRTLSTQNWPVDPLRRMLSGARLLIAPTSPWSRVGTARGAFPALPKPLGDRVTATAVRLRQPLRNGRPTFSDAVNTHTWFYRRSHLSDQPPLDVFKEAYRRKILAATPPGRSGPPLASIPAAGADVGACVQAMLDDMNIPVEASKAASEAWAAGDVAGALKAPRGVSWACEVLWPGDWERSVGFQTEAIAMALDMPGKVVAAADIGQLVAQDGILRRLRAMGLEVSGPMQPTEDGR